MEKKVEENEEIHRLRPSLVCRDGHEFEYVNSREVKCKKCPLGYMVSPGTEVKDGKIYIHGQFVV